MHSTLVDWFLWQDTYWFSVTVYVQFKVLLLIYKALNGLSPIYLGDHLLLMFFAIPKVSKEEPPASTKSLGKNMSSHS